MMNKYKKERMELTEAASAAAHTLYWELMGPKVFPVEKNGVFELLVVTDYPKSYFPEVWEGFTVRWSSPIYDEL